MAMGSTDTHGYEASVSDDHRILCGLGIAWYGMDVAEAANRFVEQWP